MANTVSKLSSLAAAILALVLLCGFAAVASGAERRPFTVNLGGRTDQRSALVCLPKGKGPFAAVVFNHGSIVDGWGWPEASKKGYRLDNVCEKLASEGYFVFAPIRENYPRGKGFMNYEDSYREIVSQAIDHVKTLPEVDKTRVALAGFSMGGLVSYKVAPERTDLSAVALLAPAFGRGLLAEAAKNSGSLSAPMLVLVEEHDEPHILRGVGAIEDAARANGKRLQTIRYNRGGGHELFYDVGYWWEDFARFLRDHLGS